MKYIGLLLFYFFCFSNIHGQEIIAFDDFLKTKLSENNDLFKLNAGERSFRPSWIDEIQLRTRTDEFDFDRQLYMVRVTPSTGKVRKKQKNLHNLYQRDATLKQDDWKRDFVKSAYTTCLNIHQINQELGLQKELLNLLTDQELVFQKLTQRPGFNVKELIALQKDIYNLKIDIRKNENQYKSILRNNQQVDLSTLISIESIERKIQEELNTTPAYAQQENALEQQLIDAEIELEQAERKQYLDYVQVRYEGPHDDMFKERVSVGIGFQIPMSSDYRLKIEELLLEKESLGSEYLAEIKARQIRSENKIIEIQLLIEEYKYTQQLMQAFNTQSEELAQRASQEQISTPLLFLYNKSNQIKQEIDLLDIKQEIYSEYLDLMTITGTIYELPFRNCLVE